MTRWWAGGEVGMTFTAGIGARSVWDSVEKEARVVVDRDGPGTSKVLMAEVTAADEEAGEEERGGVGVDGWRP